MSFSISKKMNWGVIHFRAVALAAPILFFSIAPSFAGDVALGQTIAQKWCASCHLVGQSGKTIDAAPSFDMIANNSAYTDSRLRGWLFNPHPPMPNFELSKTQIDAIIAYIRSLKQAR